MSQRPNYRVTKPAGSSLLIESRTASDDTEGVTVDPINPIDAAPEVGGAAEIGQGGGVGNAAGVAEVGAGPGLQDQGSDQVDNHPEGDIGGDGGVVVGQGGGEHPEDPGHSPHARRGVRVRARLTAWDRACGGPGGLCGRCVQRYLNQNMRE